MKVPRLMQDEFNAVFKQRGWTGKNLSVDSKMSERWISEIIENPLVMMAGAGGETEVIPMMRKLKKVG